MVTGLGRRVAVLFAALIDQPYAHVAQLPADAVTFHFNGMASQFAGGAVVERIAAEPDQNEALASGSAQGNAPVFTPGALAHRSKCDLAPIFLQLYHMAKLCG